SLFVTMALGIIHADTGHVQITCGGHPPLLIRRADRKVERIPQPAGRLLGFVVGPQQFQNSELQLQPQDTIMLYTDGLTETYDQSRQTMFGLDRLVTVLQNLPQETNCESWEHTIKASLETFSGKTENEDDLTIFLLRRL
ncbi:MAG TPA: PP2C family protein-serine/threonine phosphatase, partial [Gemmatales bacterium]|nr:PP2C family protein-serine/threonine phosphatase [Gemmatales bacterium]